MGLVHRDLKPGNIFAAQRGGVYDVAKLLDFGLVKPVAEIESTQLTQEGSITGSPLYMCNRSRIFGKLVLRPGDGAIIHGAWHGHLPNVKFAS